MNANRQDKRQGIRREPWQCVWHASIAPLLSIGVLQILRVALEDERTPGNDLVRREVARAIEHATWCIVEDPRGRPRKEVGSHDPQ
jgi:hypothetical protein